MCSKVAVSCGTRRTSAAAGPGYLATLTDHATSPYLSRRATSSRVGSTVPVPLSARSRPSLRLAISTRAC